MTKKLLLADDSVTIQRVIELTFADEDIQVIAVGDGRQAIERLDRDPPDIVLADVGMPQVDGYEVASYMKSNPRLARIPVILLAGAFDPIDEARAKTAGCDGVLAKPFEPQQVIARVRQLLEGGKDGGEGAVNTTGPIRDMAGGAPGRDVLDDLALRPTPGTPPDAGSLDDYFDRLDQDLASSKPGGPAPPGPARAPAADAPASNLKPAVDASAPKAPIPQGWSPPETAAEGDAPTLVNQARTPAGAGDTAATYAGPPPAMAGGSIADAFAALLAAEQGAPPPPAQFAAPILNDETIELLVARVLERMTGNTVADIVTRVAERLVREEIDRIKNAR